MKMNSRLLLKCKKTRIEGVRLIAILQTTNSTKGMLYYWK